MDPQPPTLSLPPLRNIDAHSLSTVTAALINLRALYWPASLTHAAVRCPKPRANQRIHDSGYASEVEGGEEGEEEQDETLMLLRADALERAFVVRWLTGFIARSEEWINNASILYLADADHKFMEDKERENRAHVVDEAAALLALSADTQADGALARRFSFPVERGGEIVVEVRDESYEQDHESVGLQTWGSACVLAERICAEPAKYLGLGSQRRGGTIRVLELGAGTGLLSMVVAKLQRVCELGVHLDVVATDYHPAVLENLQENVAHNSGSCVDSVRVEKLDWADTPVIQERDMFDVILAADVIYDERHGAWIKSCAERMLRNGEGRVMWLIVPVRPTRIGEVGRLDEVFHDNGGPADLMILGVEDIPRCNSVGRADEVGYRLFQIGRPG